MTQSNALKTPLATLESTDKSYEIKNLDHLGLIAAQFDDLGLVELIDSMVPQDKEKRTVSLGQSVKAMVINGLGFANHTLYLMPEFFADKPVERLIGSGITANDLNQNLFGRNLDEIHEFDVTQFYMRLSAHTVRQLELPCLVAHIDTTSFHVDGDYNSDRDAKEGVVKITKGYSRDHRPDLNQVGLQLIVENQAGIPLVMQALDGNSSDKNTFSAAINTHVKQIQTDLGIEYIVGDSALYTAKSLEEMKDIFWISRVPETLSDAKYIIEEMSPQLMVDIHQEASSSVCMDYAGVQQRWVVNYSPQAYQRALKSVNKQCLELSMREFKKFEKLCQNEFACEKDAIKALDAFEKELKMTDVSDFSVIKKPRFNKKGRPAKDAQPDYYTWKIEGGIASMIETREVKLRRKSCFILATNQLDDSELSEKELIRKYKQDQQKVERGFRFLKDPQFLAATLYLKKPERIAALLMIMTLSLLIYATLEYRIRKALVEEDKTFPNQKNQSIQNPTARWVFQYFSGIHELTIIEKEVLIINLKVQQLLILKLLGKGFQQIYAGTRRQV
jgi:transposase